MKYLVIYLLSLNVILEISGGGKVVNLYSFIENTGYK